MRRVPVGTLVGGLIGLPAGVFGVGFGLLVGTLVDQALLRARERRSITRLVENPLDDTVQQSLSPEAAVLVLAFVAGGTLSPDTRARVLQWLIERYSTSRRRTVELERIAQDGPELALQAASADLAEFLRRRLPPAELEAVIELYLSIGCPALRVRRLSERWQIPAERYRVLRDPYRVLDSRACAVLGVSPAAGPEEVKRVYRALAVQFHPDAAAGLDESQRRQAEQAYLKVQAAYQTIMREFDI